MLQNIINLALSSARVLPAIEMLRDFSEAAEAEAKAGAQALFGLGLAAGLGVAFLCGAGALFCLRDPYAALGFLAVAAPCVYAGVACKKRLDITRAKLEQLKGAALAARAAKSIASKTVELGIAAYDSALSGGRAAAAAASQAASSVGQAATSVGNAAASLPSAAANAAAPVGKAAQSKTDAAMEAVAAASAALSDPATRQAATQLAGEAMQGAARMAGLAAGWLKSKQAPSTPAPTMKDITPTTQSLPAPQDPGSKP